MLTNIFFCEILNNSVKVSKGTIIGILVIFDYSEFWSEYNTLKSKITSFITVLTNCILIKKFKYMAHPAHEDTIELVKEIFRSYLKEGNQRQTPERFMVLEEIYRADGHFDADDIFFRMQDGGTRVSRAMYITRFTR